MELTAAEGRVLGCLIETQPDDPEITSVSLDELRYACNQASGQDPAARYDDRLVEDTLVSLKSKGLARYVVLPRGVGPVRYRQLADERWRLSRSDLAVLAALLLRGPQTAREVQATVGPARGGQPVEVEASLDTLAGRTPTPLATRLAPAWGEETLWAEVLTGRPTSEELAARRARRAEHPPAPAASQPRRQPPTPSEQQPGRGAYQPSLAEVADRLANIERRLAGIEAALGGLRSGREGPGPPRPGQPRQASGHESTRVIR